MDGLKPLAELAVTTIAVMAMILVIKYAAEYLPSNGFPGAAKGLVRMV